MGEYETLSGIDYNQVHVIDVIFGTETTEDSDYECKTSMLSGESGTCSVGKYMTHPAFISFDTDSSITKGMWVGKFETGYKDALNKTEAEKNENNPDAVQIKPNVYSWREIQVVNAYYTSYNYKQNLNSHMIKNTEWGAVAYLHHSNYGSRESVRINNNESFMTGYAGVNEPTTGYTTTNISCTTTPSACNEYGTSSSITKSWNTDTGALASTTKNITGIYDMSGGAWEYVMGVMLSIDNQTPCSGRDSSNHSGFNGPYCNVANSSKTDGVPFPIDPRYYDLYIHGTTSKQYDRRILGDATGEMGPFVDRLYGSQIGQTGSWYDDEAWFVYTGDPWFVRGDTFSRGTETGVFALNRDRGSVHKFISFRIVLTPQEG